MIGRKLVRLFGIVAIAIATSRLSAQHEHQEASAVGTGMVDMNSASMFLMNESSGTAMNPAAWPMPMLMLHFGKWNTMFMGTAFLVDTQQSGPRGGDKLYSPNWFMVSSEHRVGPRGAF